MKNIVMNDMALAPHSADCEEPPAKACRRSCQQGQGDSVQAPCEGMAQHGVGSWHRSVRSEFLRRDFSPSRREHRPGSSCGVPVEVLGRAQPRRRIGATIAQGLHWVEHLPLGCRLPSGPRPCLCEPGYSRGTEVRQCRQSFSILMIMFVCSI
jgi:hypothetical protein